MRAKRIGLLLAVIVLISLEIGLITSAIGCEKPSTPPSVFTGKVEINWGAGVTVGNHTYLPMNVRGYPAEHAQSILQVLDAFEKDHPELEITSWAIEKQQSSRSTNNYIFGIWINHRPKR